jgi:hypothetical protein
MWSYASSGAGGHVDQDHAVNLYSIIVLQTHQEKDPRNQYIAKDLSKQP